MLHYFMRNTVVVFDLFKREINSVSKFKNSDQVVKMEHLPELDTFLFLFRTV